MFDIDKTSFTAVGQLLAWKQKYVGLLVGMGKGAVNRLMTGERSETLMHKETLSMITYLDEKNLLGKYVEWRFGFKVKKHFYKNDTPMEHQKYINIIPSRIKKQ